MARYFMGGFRGWTSRNYGIVHGVSHDFCAGSRSVYTVAGHAQKAADFLLAAMETDSARAKPERRAA